MSYIRTMVRLEDDSWDEAGLLPMANTTKLARAKMNAGVCKLLTGFRNQLTFCPRGVCVIEGPLFEPIQVYNASLTHAPNEPLRRIGQFWQSEIRHDVTIYSRPVSEYERQIKKVVRVFLIATDNGRWIRYEAKLRGENGVRTGDES